MFIYSKVCSAIIIGLVAGCSTSSKPTTSVIAKDPFMETYDGIPFSGLLEGGSSGKFTDLIFEKALLNGKQVTENDLIVRNLTGSVEIWESTGPVSYAVTGRFVGRDLVVTLQNGNAAISGTGTLVGNNLFNASCDMVLNYNGKERTVSLTITTEAVIANAKTDYLESQGIK